ncbi:MAG: putative excisionase [Podoviridae sp. ctDWo9]|nr:MAG: putative excisionase [Podoviridae sp. ctDWo9]
MENVDAVEPLDTVQSKYLDWLVTAPSERVPATKLEFAELVGVNVRTLRRWQAGRVFRDTWAKRVEDIQGSPERTQTLLDTLYRKGCAGDVKSAQLYLQATNRMSPPTVEVRSEKRAAELTDSELDDLIAAMASRERSSRLKVVV